MMALASPTVDPLIAHPTQQSLQPTQLLNNPDKMLVHVLRCPQCTFLTLAQKRLQQHIADSHPGEAIFYTMHTCAICNAVTTEKHLMEEHRLLYHCGETEDTLPALPSATIADGGQLAAVSAATTSLAGAMETKIAMDSVLLGNLSSMLDTGSSSMASIPNQPVFPSEYLTTAPIAVTSSGVRPSLHGNGLFSNYTNKRRCQRSYQQRQVARAAAFLGLDSAAVGPILGRQSLLMSHNNNNHHHNNAQPHQQQPPQPPNGVELMEDEAYLGEESAKPWLCRVCSSCFPHQACLRRHMKLHDTNKRFKCDKCHKRFSYRCNLMLHYRTHTNERPFHCATCGARFNQRVHLQNHMQNVHSGPNGVRPPVTHECDVCGAWFVQINALTRHQRLHHDQNGGSSVGSKRVADNSRKTEQARTV